MAKLAKDIMTPHVKSVPENWTLQKFAGFLTENSISGSPVVNPQGQIVGIATLTDIADFHLNEVDQDYEARMTPEEQREARRLRQFMFEGMTNLPVEVRDVMSPILVSVDETSPVTSVAQKMMDEHLHRIFVTSADEVVGIITTFDMLKIVAEG